MGRLIKIHDVDQFFEVVYVPDAGITSQVLEGVRQLDERTELEPMLRELLWDPTETPHGPTEIADILTTKVRIRGKRTLAAFVLKGKSFAKVRPEHIDHQVIRLRQLPGLGLMALVAVGHIQDNAQRDFLQMAMDADCDSLVIDAQDCARLLVAYEKVCPLDGTPFGPVGGCKHGHAQDEGVKLTVHVRDGLHYEVPRLRDVSHKGARRLTATVLVNPQYDREVLREIIREATLEVRTSSYCRSKQVASQWGNTNAHVVWLFLAVDHQDVTNANWVARTQWIDPNLSQTVRPIELSASEQVDSISVHWNQMYRSLRTFHTEHSVDKGRALDHLEPLLERATRVGAQVSAWFDALERGELDDATLTSRIRAVSDEIAEITDQAMQLSFPPQDVRDYDTRAQSLFGHLDNMKLYYSKCGIETWPQKNRTIMMRLTVEDFRSDLERLEFEREKLH